MKIVISLSVLAVVLLQMTYAAQLPTGVPRCRQQDTVCLQSAIGEAIQKLKHGNQKINLLPLEPLNINELSIEQGGSSSVNINMQITNIDIHGFSDTKISKLESFSTDRLDWKITAGIPRIELEGDYVSRGRILILPINGDGRCNLTLVDLDLVANIRSGEPVTRKDKIYFPIEDFELQFQPRRMYLTFDDPNQDPLLRDQTNIFLNESWKDLFEELKPSLQDSFSALFKEITTRIFNKVPAQDMFLQD